MGYDGWVDERTMAPPSPATMSLAAASLASLSASSLSWYLAAVASAWENTVSIDFNISPGVGSRVLVERATRPLALSWSRIITWQGRREEQLVTGGV